jgi:predicted permease
MRLASTGYFRTMTIPLSKGRFFSDHDNAGSEQVAIIDQKFAERFWPRENPIGKHLFFDPKKPFTITGVVGSVKQYGLDMDSKIVVYFAHLQVPSGGMFLVARTSGDPATLAGAIVREIHTVDPGVAVYGIRKMDNILHDSLARQRFASTMLGAFAGFALLLAAVGIYGVMSYLVSQGTHDIGVRLALGAQAGNIFGLVLRNGAQLTVVGIVAGLAGSIALTRVMSSLLYNTSARDAVTLSAVSALLAAVALAATIIPARRALRVDPMIALRQE